jgi:glycosyltransferase involved in cell wall biosynthesis
MATHWQTEIVTTCALDYMTWVNFYPKGIEQVGTTVIRRFSVDRPRDVQSFNRLSSELHAAQTESTLAEQENWMRAQGPMSKALLDYLKEHEDSYDLFIFFGYLYATTYFGLPLVKERAFLAPLAHDEWTIYLTMWDQFFALPELFIFNSSSEREFLLNRFPHAGLAGPVVGVGIEPPKQIDIANFVDRYNLTVPFLLYVGRIDESKGCATMFEYFLRWKERTSAPHKLLLLGQEIMPVPFHDEIIHLGFVEDAQKWAAMKACDWLILPSPHESLSMALLETWSVGRPALVNGECAVLVSHCQQSHGGLWYTSLAEWCAALESVTDHTKKILGEQGRSYVEQRYGWDRVVAAYINLVTPVTV